MRRYTIGPSYRCQPDLHGVKANTLVRRQPAGVVPIGPSENNNITLHGFTLPLAMRERAPMARGPRHPTDLNDKERLIFAALREASRPLTAYDLIALLNRHGISSPPTVYRALKRLTDLGHAHRIESLNAFVACAQGVHAKSAAFAICSSCGSVIEFDGNAAVSELETWAKTTAFNISRLTMEVHGTCRVCAAAAAGRGS